jgi:hypothetical protein
MYHDAFLPLRDAVPKLLLKRLECVNGSQFDEAAERRWRQVDERQAAKGGAHHNTVNSFETGRYAQASLRRFGHA